MMHVNANSEELEKKGTETEPESVNDQQNEAENLKAENPVTPTEVQNEAPELEKGPDVAEEKIEEKPVVEEVKAEATPAVVAETPADDSENNDGASEEEDTASVDFSKMSKSDLSIATEELLAETDIRKIEKALKEIQPLFQEIKDELEKSARERFLESGGDEADFEMHWDEDVIRYEKALKVLKERKYYFYQDQEKQREHNLNAKNALLERLRVLVDGEETVASISALKEVQTEWKKIGQVPSNQVRPLWASYNALIDRFYDQRSIYFELKELDRKKNLEAKHEICEKAEKLDAYDNIRDAIKELNDLHEEFKHIGPVPKDDQETLWNRFKTASDKIYAKRKQFNEQVKKELFVNLNKKQELIAQVEAFASFSSDRINEWNTKTRELIELQKVWDKTGGMPKEKAKEVNRKFWTAFKAFFQNKNQFFKKLEAFRDENLNKKKALVAKAIELQDSNDFQGATEQLKKLQQEWKKIGPVPEKLKEEIFTEFKTACDHFFNRRRDSLKVGEKVFMDNLKAKEALCEELEKAVKSGESEPSRIEDYMIRWSAIGFVPRDSMKKIQKRFNEAIEAYAGGAKDLSGEEIEQLKVKTKLIGLKNDPDADRKIQNREGGLRKKISGIENEILLWKNNMEFFASSANADKLKKEFQQKIDKAQEEIEDLKRQLDVLRDF
jgi:hypothetical protein